MTFIKDRNPIVYSSDIMLFFNQLARSFLEPIEQPKSSHELIYATSKADREDGLAAVRIAAQLARQDRECEVKGDMADARYSGAKCLTGSHKVCDVAPCLMAGDNKHL